MSLETSSKITVREIVMRVTPPSIPAAPTSAYSPGSTLLAPSSRISSPASRPTAAPVSMQGTKRPEGMKSP